jgi:dTDP-4-amino-4,6-dideoxygalactose transaminase
VKVPFVDLAARVRELRPQLDAAVARVLDSGWFILGPEAEAFERELATALGSRQAGAVANGTDALQLALRALGVGEGHEVVTSPISAAFTALAIQQCGARPVFVDVDPVTLNLDPERVAGALKPRARGHQPGDP